jgi:hypothetical protein
MGGEVHPIPSHPVGLGHNPIPWDNNFFKSVPWDGMGLSHPIRSLDSHIEKQNFV